MLTVEQLKALPPHMLTQPVSIKLTVGQCVAAARAMECADAAAEGLGLRMPSGPRAEFDLLKATFEAAAILALVALEKNHGD